MAQVQSSFVDIDAESRFRLLADAASEAIALVDGDRIREANQAFLNLSEILDEPSLRALALPHASGASPRELCVRRVDGHALWFAVRDKDITYCGRKARVAVLLDVTEQREAAERAERTAEELSRSNAELDHFAQIVSHDLREPLRMVSSFVTLLARKYRGRLDADADDYIGYAVDGARRARSLIESLLAYARASKTYAPTHRLDIGDLLAEVLDDLKFTIDGNHALVTVEPMPSLCGDAVGIGQLFQNLISNAILYCGTEPPRVHIGATRDAEGWCFSVKDNGLGINQEYTDKLFRLFARRHQEDNMPSTGVGLAICKRIVERHQGRIWAESEEGKGSVFYFTLPSPA